MRTSKYTPFLVGALVAIILTIGMLVAFGVIKLSPSEQEWVPYTNDEYGYQIMATEGYGRVLEENLLVIEADVPEGADTDPGGEARVFYFNDMGFENQLGTISCYETYQPWEELSNEMPLKDYAETLYEIEMAIDPGPNYGQKLPIANLHLVSLDDEEAYSYVYGRERDGVVDINAATITENAEGQKCWIRYPVTDHSNGFDPEMLERRTYWFNSFTWIR